MELVLFKYFGAAVLLAISMAAGIWPFQHQRQHLTPLEWPLAEALTAGVFLGAGMLHMLGDAMIMMADAGYQYPLPILLAASAFCLMFFLEHVLFHLFQADHAHTSVFAILAVVMLSLHSVIEGAAMGISLSIATVVIIFIAILAHQWAASFALAVLLTQSGIVMKRGLLLFLIFCIMIPLGIFIGEELTHFTKEYFLLVPICNSLAAGTFIYLGTVHGLKRSVFLRACQKPMEFAFLLAGFGLMAIVAIWV